MNNNIDKTKKPLKLSSSGRMQIRKNLGPTGDKSKASGNKKTIQIVFRNKNNQQKSSSTSQSNYRGSSSFRSAPNQTNTNFTTLNKNKNFENKNKKNADLKKQQPKKSTLKPTDKIDAKKILEQEDQEFDRFPSLAKIKRAREKEKLKITRSK